MTPLERAEQAKQLLASPVFRAVMDGLREDTVRALEGCPAESVDLHHEGALMLKTIALLRLKLQKYADELLIDKQKQAATNWRERARETLSDLMPPRRVR